MIMTVTIKQIIDAPLVDSLEYICEEHNLNIDDVRQEISSLRDRHERYPETHLSE